MDQLTRAEAQVMRGITAREGRRAAAERREAQATFKAELKQREARPPASVDAAPIADEDWSRRVYLTERERDRVEHRVLGKARTAAPLVRPSDMPRQVWKVERKRIEAERQARDREDAAARGTDKGATPETLAKFAEGRTRRGALARLVQSGQLDEQQLVNALQIAAAHERIGADVAVRTASLETRVDRTPHGDGLYEAIGQVRHEIAYTRWRSRAEGPVALLLEVIVHDVGVTIAARRHAMHVRRARRLLSDALDLWPRIVAEVRREVDDDALTAAHAALLGAP